MLFQFKPSHNSLNKKLLCSDAQITLFFIMQLTLRWHPRCTLQTFNSSRFASPGVPYFHECIQGYYKFQNPPPWALEFKLGLIEGLNRRW